MGEPSIADLAVRLVASLAVVVGILLLIARTVNKRFAAPKGAAVQVVHRQAIGRGQGVAVVAVGTRVLVLGTTEHQITLLAEVEPDEVGLGLEEDDPATDAAQTPSLPGPLGALTPALRLGARAQTAAGPLAGSLLSLQTWRQAAAAVTGRGARTPAEVEAEAPPAVPVEVPAPTTTSQAVDFADLLADAVPDERAS